MDRPPGKRDGTLRDAARKLDAKLSEAERRIQTELEQLVSYVDREVVPSVRNHSSRTLRIAAEKMTQLADYMDRNTPRRS